MAPSWTWRQAWGPPSRGQDNRRQLQKVIRQLQNIIEDVESMQQFPVMLSTRVYDSIMLSENLPWLTGTYAGAIIHDIGEGERNYSRVFMTTASLLASAAEHVEVAEQPEAGHGPEEVPSVDPEAYAFGIATPTKAKGGEWHIEGYGEPYPLRLERIGSPTFDSGQDLWATADRDAAEFYQSEIQRFRKALRSKVR